MKVILNAVRRAWLARFSAGARRARAYDALMKRLRHIHAGRHYSRDEMNER